MENQLFEDLPKLNGTAEIEFLVNGSPIIIEVYGNDAPITAGNFVDLVEKGVYDNIPFHRVITEPEPFVAQGGDPQGKDPNFPISGLGTGGYIDPDTGEERTIPLEIKLEGDSEPTYSTELGQLSGNQPPDVVLENELGSIAMARTADPDSASSQFFFALDELEFLDGDYAVFGQVTEGLDVLTAIEEGDRIEDAEVISGLDNLVTEGTDTPDTSEDEDTDTPVDEDTDTPVDEDTDTPVDEDTDTPVDEDTDTPEDEDTDTPVDEDTDTPVDEDTDTPEDEDTPDTPVDEDTPDTPVDEDIPDTPVDEDIPDTPDTIDPLLVGATFGTSGEDTLESGNNLPTKNRVAFAGEGNDLYDLTASEGNNRLFGGAGEDTFTMGANDTAYGGDDSDRFFFTAGGNNVAIGGAGADQFWIASAEIPESTNVISDYEVDVDVIGVAGLNIGFDDLQLKQVNDNTVVAANGSDLAIFLGVNASELSADNFVIE